MSRSTRGITGRGAIITLWVAGALLGGASCTSDDIAEPTRPDSPEAGPALAATVGVPLAFTQVSAGSGVASGGDYTCGVTTDNRAYCWGYNVNGQLGNDTRTGPETCPIFQTICSTRPVLVAGGLSFRQVSVGDYAHTCGVTTDYRAYCWGGNWAGQLGDGTTTSRLRPVAVAGGLRFRQVDAGVVHTCGVSYPDNRAYCWGGNAYGQVGDLTTTTRVRPVAVAGGHFFSQVTTGSWHTCGLTTTSEAFCWGWNRYGQLGDSTKVNRRKPSQVAGARQFRQLSAGYNFTCGVTTGNRAFCWGDGGQGQLGNGKAHLSLWPQGVSGGLLFERVTAGEGHACAETTGNVAYCWGSGIGGSTSSVTPVAVAGGLSFNQLSAGEDHICGKTAAGVAYCWGWNYGGELGDGTTSSHPTPVAVAPPAP